jgi:hypothetical protein
MGKRNQYDFEVSGTYEILQGEKEDISTKYLWNIPFMPNRTKVGPTNAPSICVKT